MLHFDRVSIGHQHYMMKELTFNHAIKIAKMDSNHIERRLTVFLQDVLQDEMLPLSMTVQERYCLLLNYLDQAKDTLIGMSSNAKDFLIDGVQPWQTQIEHGSISVRQLIGYDAELLEKHCLNLADWLAASMALQLHDSDSAMPPAVDYSATEEEKMSRVMQRLDYIKSMPISEFNRYFELLMQANQDMQSLVRIGFDDTGITLRGTDDAPYRFCPSSTFYGIVEQLDGHFATVRARDGG